jgi:hypothetical protein
VRLQELGELHQASIELKQALTRAELRAENQPSGNIKAEHFSQIIVAMDYVVESLETLLKAHPGDNLDTLKSIVAERSNAPGWENWSRLLKQRLELTITSKPRQEPPLIKRY